MWCGTTRGWDPRGPSLTLMPPHSRKRLTCLDLPGDSRETTEMVAGGALRVEARRPLGKDKWLLASERERPGHYMELRHHLPSGGLWITGVSAPSFAGLLRRDFRVHVLRETRPPAAARALAGIPPAAVRPAQSGPARPIPPDRTARRR